MTTITEDYVSFETAKLLKEKGFNLPCRTNYRSKYPSIKTPFFHNALKDFNEEYKGLNSEWYSAPTLQMAMKWLREVHNISVEPLVDFGSGDGYWWAADVAYIKKDGLIDELCGYNSYEEACESAIKYCLENLI